MGTAPARNAASSMATGTPPLHVALPPHPWRALMLPVRQSWLPSPRGGVVHSCDQTAFQHVIHSGDPNNIGCRGRSAKVVQRKIFPVCTGTRYLTDLYASERGSGYGRGTDHYGTRNWVLRGAVNGPYIVCHRIDDSSATVAITLFVELPSTIDHTSSSVGRLP